MPNLPFILRKKAENILSFLKIAPPFFVWEYFVASFLLTVFTVTLASWLIPKSQDYSQLIVGSLAWRMSAKNVDYTLPLVALMSYPISYLFLQKLSIRVKHQQGLKVEQYFRKLLTYSFIPSAIWLGSQLIGKADDRMLFISVLFSIEVTFFTILSLLKKINFHIPKNYFEILAYNLLTIIFSGFTGIALILGLNRIPSTWKFVTDDLLTWVVAIATLLSLISLLILWHKNSDNAVKLRQASRVAVVISQLCLPLLFLVLLPVPWISNEEKFYGYSFRASLVILIVGLILVSIYDILRRLTQSLNLGQRSSLSSAISPLCLIALLLFLKSSQYTISSVPADDYHYGEFLLPWWLWQDFSYLPFQDYTPARGLVNYVPGFLVDLFYDGTASAFSAVYGRAIQVLPFLAVGFLSLATALGLLPAFVAIFLAPQAGGLMEIYILLTAALCWLGKILIARKWITFLIEWLVICTALLLFAPGQGALFSLGTFPLTAIALYRSLQSRRFHLQISALSILIVSVIAVFLTPLDGMILGALRYGIEQSSTNSIAYGVEWNISFGSHPMLSSMFWEIIRASWIFVGIAAILMAIHTGSRASTTRIRRYFTYSIPVILFAVLWITRSVGRIDITSPSRLEEASTWFVCLLLPLLLLTAYRHRPAAVLSLAGIGSILASVFSSVPVVSQVLSASTTAIEANTQSFTNGTAIKLPNLGQTMIEQGQLNRLSFIKTVLSSLLEEGETYLDLTNRNAQYFYLGYPPPIEVGAVYNLVHKSQQIRAIQDLERLKPPIVLASAENILHDGGTVALRSHHIYRYVVENYIPFELNSMIFMIRADQVNRLGDSFINAISSSNLSTNYQVLLKDKTAQQQAIWEITNVNQMMSNVGLSNNPAKPDPIANISLNHEILNDWHLRGTRDFNSDGVLDVLLQNKRENKAQIHLMTADGRTQAIKPLPSLQPGWDIVGIRESAIVKAAKDGLDLSKKRQLELLDLAFRVEDLQYIPSSWGSSFGSLQTELELISEITPDLPKNLRGLQEVEANQYQVQDRDPSISVDLSDLKLDGRDAGILAFDLSCSERIGTIPLEIYWSSESLAGLNEQSVVRFLAKQGKVLIPLDASPRWLLAQQIQTLRIDLQDPVECPQFSIKNIQLFQRKGVSE